MPSVRPPSTTLRVRVTTVMTLAAALVAAGSFTVPSAEASPAAASSVGETDPRTASEQLTPARGMLFGAHVAGRAAGDAESSVAAFETDIGRKLDLMRWYVRWDTPMPPNPVVRTIERGRTPVLSIEPTLEDRTRLPWAQIAQGAHDTRIREQAAAVRSLGVPVFLTFHHEPDYATGHGTPAEFRAAWRHFVEVFRQEGATNVAWTWVMTPGSFGAAAVTAGAEAYYPGDDVVDWLALDPYNWNACTTGVPSRWRPMSEIAGPFRAWGQARGKPLMLAEWGSFEDSTSSTRKANWYRESMSTLAGWPEVKAVVAFHAHGNCAWWVDSTPTSLQGFVDAGARSTAHARANAWLRPSVTHGTAPLTLTLDASGSTGTASRNGSGITSWSLALGDGTVRTGQGQPPSDLTHTYAAGTYEARLTVTDATGSSNVDRRTVQAAPAPTLTASERERTATSIQLNAWVNPHGHAATVRFEWGPSTGYGSSSPVIDVADVPYAKHVTHTASGLPVGSRVYWRVTATTVAGTSVLTRVTDTHGPPTSTGTLGADRTRTSATVRVGVHPHLLATSARLEWGTSPALGSSTVPQQVDALTWEKTVTFRLDGLLPGRTYHYRLVATNSLGTVTGPVRTVTTLP
ncbi:PKD domain-containing protein [Actinotalea sp. K2]|uniref:PKD domain-containing protein n=1 Tax=Actinotalea sp. K2 TaxID=2939438 RepID=UPI002018181B|nr:PKD domain-containing protein [Actinotalea sp. K2]MCL3861411.1 PKD domain-containing protein [Actinotalea sp. K2]